MTVYVLNTRLSLAERKEAGQALVERIGAANVAMSGWSDYHVLRTTPTHEVLTSDDFLAQRDEFVAHVRKEIEFFRTVGYL